MREPSAEAERWLSEARAGSHEALGRTLEACRRYLLLVADQELDADLRAKGGASDIVQQTFLEAQRDFARFQGDSEAELLAWLRRLLVNNLADFRRLYRGTSKRRVDQEVALQQETPSGGPGIDHAADTPSPSVQAMEREQAESLKRAMSRLPEDFRRVLVLRYEQERSFEEIGELMERSATAARNLWARAVERLQQEMDRSP